MYIGNIAAASNREDYGFDATLSTRAGLPVDLTGSTIVVAIREPGHVLPALSFTNGAGVTLTAPTAGSFALDISRADMTKLLAGSFDIGVTVKLATGRTFQLIAGSLPVVDGVVAQ